MGDSDQAIYGWRGADYENQQRYDDDFRGAITETGEELPLRATHPVRGVGGRRVHHA